MENNHSVSTTLNISNTDIVTMLIAEKKELIKAEVDRLSNKKIDIIGPYLETLKSKINSFYLSKEFLDFKEQVYIFCKIYNPDIEITLDLCGNFERSLFYVMSSQYNIDKKIKYSPDTLVINCSEDDEDKFISPFERDMIDYPSHLIVKYKLEFSTEDFEECNKIVEKIQSLMFKMRDTGKMKEDMVAAMTKQAILKNPDLLSIRATVLQLPE